MKMLVEIPGCSGRPGAAVIGFKPELAKPLNLNMHIRPKQVKRLWTVYTVNDS